MSPKTVILITRQGLIDMIHERITEQALTCSRCQRRHRLRGHQSSRKAIRRLHHSRWQPLSREGRRCNPKSPIRKPARHNQILQLDVIGLYMMVESFLRLLKKSPDSCVLFISSSLGSISFVTTPNSIMKDIYVSAYRYSKAAMDMMMGLYAKQLKKEGVKFWAINPGFLATNSSGDA
jgi:NAD(P)-dependent dehydrogenase (short-subunit alcohol dehydrogenase family)